MKQVILKCIVAACFVGRVCWAGINGVKSTCKTNAVTTWYSTNSMKLTQAIEDGLEAQSPSVAESIIAAGNLRLVDAEAILFATLGKSKRRLQIKTSPAIIDIADFSSTPIVISFGSSENITLNFPAFYAISMISPNFESCKQAFSTKLQQRSAIEYVMLSRLAFYSGGNYFTKLFDSNDITVSGEYFNIVSNCLHHTPLPLEYVRHHQGQDDISSKYFAVQKEVIRQFGDELMRTDANLPDTIATMGFIRSLDAIPVLADNLTICPQVSTNAPGGYVFPAAEALISIGPAIGDCFERLKATKPLSVEESLWLRISHELYPEGLEYELFCAAATNDVRAARLLQSLPWRRLSEDDML